MLRQREVAPILILMLAAWLAACAGGATPPTPSIEVEPTSGLAGTDITVTGKGFPAGVEISIRLGPPGVGASPEAYAVATTTGRGAFVTAFVLPEMWPDGTPIVEEALLIIALTSDGSVKATASFNYRAPLNPTPEFALDPANGEPGQHVVVTGANFPSSAPMTLHLSSPASDHVGEVLAQIVSDEHGSFRTVIAIPITWSDSNAPVREQELLVEAISADGGERLSQATFFNVAGEKSSE